MTAPIESGRKKVDDGSEKDGTGNLAEGGRRNKQKRDA
jgi:hypothetical protein